MNNNNNDIKESDEHATDTDNQDTVQAPAINSALSIIRNLICKYSFKLNKKSFNVEVLTSNTSLPKNNTVETA